MTGLLIVIIICFTLMGICLGEDIIKQIGQYKSRKLIEESKTAYLAMVYQILSIRPELSLEEVLVLVDKEKNSLVK